MIRYLLSRSGRKEEYQTGVMMAVGLPCMNTTGIKLKDMQQYSTREATIVMHLIDKKMVFAMSLCLL